MSDQPKDDPGIPLMTLGELRMLGLHVPAPSQNEPDDCVLVLSRSAAIELVSKILVRWHVPDEEAKDFLNEITDAALHDVLVIHQLLLVLFRRNLPGDYIQATNKLYGGKTSWDVIRNGGSEAVRRDIAHHVFNGGW